MKIYRGTVKPTATPHANIRASADLQSTDIGNAYPNQTFEGEGELVLADGYNWMFVKTLNGVTINGWIAEKNLTYTTEIVADTFPKSVWLSMTADGERREYRLVE